MYLLEYNTPMSSTIDDLIQHRDSILQQMKTIGRLQRGTLSQQFFKAF